MMSCRQGVGRIFARSWSSAVPSTRVGATDAPCIVTMQTMLARHKEREGGILSLAQGIVHWAPPEEALAAARRAVEDADTNSYTSDDGYPALCDALKDKLRVENGVHSSEVMVTQGANQAYMNIVLTLLDHKDKAVIFSPFYFNHRMALQLAGADVVLGEVDASLLPDVDWLEKSLQEASATGQPIKMVTLTSPCNPTGVYVDPATIERVVELCRTYGCWLVVDNTYEHFTYGSPLLVPEAAHVLNVFSFSKGFGMMGWRVGYLAYPPELRHQILKTQDTIAICPTVISQKVAMGALAAGRGWVHDKVAALATNKMHVQAAVATLGEENVLGGTGAIYMMARLPAHCDNDVAVVEV